MQSKKNLSGSPMNSKPSGSNYLPPLISTLDTYVESGSDAKVLEIMEEVQKKKQTSTNSKKYSGKKKKKNLSPTSNHKLPERPLASPRHNGNNQLPSPKKIKANIRILADDDRDNFSLLADSIESVQTYSYPNSPPHMDHSTLSRGTTPRSAPRGGRIYKDANANIIGNHSSEVSIK